MSTNYYCYKVDNKTYHFIRTDSGRFFDVTDCHPVINRHVNDNNGLLNAKQVSAQYVADLVASTCPSGEEEAKTKRKASAKARGLRYHIRKHSLKQRHRKEQQKEVYVRK